MNEIFVSKTEGNIIIALKEEGRLTEIMVEDESKRSIVGNIYKSKVLNISEGLQAAFVDIGERKKAFLPLETPDGKVLFEYASEIEEEVEGGIVIKQGDETLVQVIRDEISTKGAKLTSYISIAGNFLVLIPFIHFVGVSRKIQDREFKGKIKSYLYSIMAPDVGVIVRTAAYDAKPGMIKRDYDELMKIWKRIEKQINRAPSPSLLYKETGITIKTIREMMKHSIDNIYIDSKELYNDVMAYFTYLNAGMKKKIHLYQFRIPMLAYYDIDREMDRMLKKEVYLKGGAYIIIEPTEALTAIDVNSGKLSRNREKDDDSLIVNVNLMAAEEIARQLRLRDIGGLIVLDFIDMKDEYSKKLVVKELKKHLRKDRSTTKTLKVSQFGLVEMTRKKIGPAVINYFVDRCDCCEGRGFIPKPVYTGLKLIRWLKENGKNHAGDTLMIFANDDLLSEIHKNLTDYLDQIMKESKFSLKIEKREGISRGTCEIFSMKKMERIASVS